ncbi:MAG: CoB--CoM heterodisulfide reductase iron-sulfur subunit B family protein [Desulfobulbaceae bacterium]|nr:CoB--CoM heterodisulfide reductase iron-sulfur subunit B family protein [Desulfobulbaceae bacterium]
MDLAYYPGCSLYQSAKLYNHQTNLVFERLGLHLQELDDWSCCGATSAGKINDFMAIALPARNLGIAEATNLPELVIPCAACYSRTKVAQKQLQDNPLLQNEINLELSRQTFGNIKVSSILEVLWREINGERFESIPLTKIEGLKAACYYGCMYTRFPYDVEVTDNVENPQAMENVLKAIGVPTLDWNHKTLCCGASSVVYNTEAALDLMAKIMKDALARGANCLVVTCPMCQMNMESQQEKYCRKHGIKERMPVYFITELLGLAFGISREEIHPGGNLPPNGLEWSKMCGDSV